MKLEIDKSKLKSELNRSKVKLVQAQQDKIDAVTQMRFSKALLEEAAPQIEVELRSFANLPTRDGLKQFYDDESYNAKRSKGWKNLSANDHFIDHWNVGFRTGRGGHGKIICENDKVVTSRKGDWDLLKLLWEGTRYYVVPAPLVIMNKEGKMVPDKVAKVQLHRMLGRSAYMKWKKSIRETRLKIAAAYSKYERKMAKYEKETGKSTGQARRKTAQEMQKEQHEILLAGGTGLPGKGNIIDNASYLPPEKEFALQGAKMHERRSITPGQSTVHISETKITMGHGMTYEEFSEANAPKKMSFYNRFKGRFYYNRYARRGIEGEVVKDFHTYVSDSIFNGLIQTIATLNKEDIEKSLEGVQLR